MPDDFELKLQPRAQETLSLEIPKETVEALRRVAVQRDMSLEALLKFYVGQGLRQDLSRLFATHVLETTAQVLARHLQSEEEISSILEEIRVEVAGTK
jgi:hypothetical protein